MFVCIIFCNTHFQNGFNRWRGVTGADVVTKEQIGVTIIFLCNPASSGHQRQGVVRVVSTKLPDQGSTTTNSHSFQGFSGKIMGGSRKYPYAPMEGHWTFLRGGRGGGGSNKPNSYKKSMKLDWNFLGGGVKACKTKNLPWGEYGYFLELHNILFFWQMNSLQCRPQLF